MNRSATLCPSLRNDFPALSRMGAGLVYLDNAATTQKPIAVLDAIREMYEHANGNVHRSGHLLGRRATERYEHARRTVQKWLGAQAPEQIIFTRGTTEAVNLVAATYGETFVSEGDEVLVTCAEHHSNFVPWQQLCLRKRARLRVLPLNPEKTIDMQALRQAIGPRTKLLAVNHVSNVLGVVNPVEQVIRIAHGYGVPVLVDGAQAASRLPLNLQTMDCDFYCLSGHKLYGPTGIGALYMAPRWMNDLPPYQFGGDMVDVVEDEKTTFLPSPQRFEAGTPNYVGAAGMASAIEYLNGIGIDAIRAHEEELCRCAFEQLKQVAGIQIFSREENCAGVISFVMDGVSCYDAALMLDACGVAVRAGVHCAQPLHRRLGVPATLRASFALYNTEEDVSALARALERTGQMLRAARR